VDPSFYFTPTFFFFFLRVSLQPIYVTCNDKIIISISIVIEAFYPLTKFEDVFTTRNGNGAGRVRVSWSYPHPHNKNSSPSPSPNPTGIQLLTHPHPHRITGIFLYPYPYPFFYCSIYQLNIFYKKNLKITPTESWYYQNIQY